MFNNLGKKRFHGVFKIGNEWVGVLAPLTLEEKLSKDIGGNCNVKFSYRKNGKDWIYYFNHRSLKHVLNSISEKEGFAKIVRIA